jgi:hypothetical protein
VATRFSWFEAICGKDGKMKAIICKICIHIKGKEKLLILNLNSLIKHFGLKKCIKAKSEIVIGELYICPSKVRVQNEKMYPSKGRDNVDVQIANGNKVKNFF